MCLAIPAKIISIKNKTAQVDIAGVKRLADIRLLKGARIGDYILIHAGFGIEKISPKEARETLKIWKAITRIPIP
jgi:hydrogenase expression/formation protein HypC